MEPATDLTVSAYPAAAQARIDELEHQVQCLLAERQPREEKYTTEYGLTRHEARFMATLKLNTVVSQKQIYSAIYYDVPCAGDLPFDKIITVFVSKIREKLKAAQAPLWIKTVWGSGYMLEAFDGEKWGEIERSTGSFSVYLKSAEEVVK